MVPPSASMLPSALSAATRGTALVSRSAFASSSSSSSSLRPVLPAALLATQVGSSTSRHLPLAISPASRPSPSVLRAHSYSSAPASADEVKEKPIPPSSRKSLTPSTPPKRRGRPPLSPDKKKGRPPLVQKSTVLIKAQAERDAIEKAARLRRLQIIENTPPPPYKGRHSKMLEQTTQPLHLQTTSDNQLDTQPEYNWSHLPHPKEWHVSSITSERKGFLGKHRYFLSNRNSVKQLVDRLGLDDISKQNNGEKVTVVEAFPGPGTITSELLKRQQVGKVIAMEQEKAYLPWLQGLAQDPTVVDPSGIRASEKLSIIPKTGFRWETYRLIEERGLLSHLKTVVQKTDEEIVKLAPLVFIAQLPNSVHGDQLLAQLTAAAANAQWLFRYGRIKLVFICPESVPSRFLAPTGSSARSRLGTLLSILHEAKVLCPNEEYFFPQANHLCPPNVAPGKRSFVVTTIPNEQYGSGMPFEELCACEFVPRATRALAWKRSSDPPEDRNVLESELVGAGDPPALIGDEYESLEYLLRNLFIARTRDLATTLERTFPGSSSILQKLTPEAIEALEVRRGIKKGTSGLVPVDASLRPIDLTSAQWVSLAQIFERWPFRPTYLFQQTVEGRRQAKSSLKSVKSQFKPFEAITMELEGSDAL